MSDLKTTTLPASKPKEPTLPFMEGLVSKFNPKMVIEIHTPFECYSIHGGAYSVLFHRLLNTIKEYAEETRNKN